MEADGGRYRAVVAWRGRESGHGLLYFVALDGEAPARDDRRDRRAPLEPGRRLEDLSDADLADRLGEGAPLTETEARFRAPDDRLWLAQSIGPVWADEEPAEGSTGLLFTSLEGEHLRLTGPGGHPGEMAGEELAELWRRAAPAEGESEDGDSDGDGGA